MKSLIVISVLALLSGFGTTLYIDHAINQMVHNNTPGRAGSYASSSSYVAETGFLVGDAPYGGPISVVSNHGLQPYGMSGEDDDTAQNIVQPTRSPQVTQHYYFLQGSEPYLQGTSPVLQATQTN